MHIALTGPASPADLAHHMHDADRARAETLSGYRGVPVSELAAALLSSGHTVEVVTTAPEVEDLIEFDGPGFRMAVAPMRSRARDRALDHFAVERAGLLEFLRSSTADVVHANWTYEFALAALDSAKPLVVTAHDAPFTVLRQIPDPYRAIRASMALRVRLRLPGLVTVSPYLEQRWRRQMFFRGQVDVIPNIAPGFEVATGSETGPSPGKTSIVSVGDATKRKNIATLLRAFAECRRAHSGMSLDLLGPGLGPSDDLAHWARRHALSEAVRFRGRVDRVELMSAVGGAAVMAHPSLEECQPVALLEAMRLGVPVVAGRGAGGVPWTLEDGQAGLLVDVRDPRSIADGILSIVNEPEKGAALAKRASERVRTTFSADVVSAQYVSLYGRTADRPKAP